jgi:hypothetical protein
MVEARHPSHDVHVDVVLGDDRVPAATPFDVTCRVTCANGCDLAGHEVELVAADGSSVMVLPLDASDGDGAAVVFGAVAPHEVGSQAWSARYRGGTTGAALHAATVVPVRFATEAHVVTVLTWGAPSAIVAGESFDLHVGVTCTSGCDLSGRAFEIFDENGMRVFTGTLSSEPLAGSDALYGANVTLAGRSSEGRARWEARFAPSDVGIAHGSGARAFGLTFVPPPESVVKIEVVDQKEGTGIRGIHVLLHPYRALTDARGVAELRVPNGSYEVFLSGFRYVPVRTTLEVAGDVTSRAELVWEPEGSDDPYA